MNVWLEHRSGKFDSEKMSFRWEVHFKTDLKINKVGDVYWIQLAQNRVQWEALVNAAMNFRIP
jgi:hypothetical protein